MSFVIPDSSELLDEAVLWHDEALELLAAGELVAAAGKVERALERFERFSGPDSPDVANLLNARGLIAWRRGDAALAHQAFERAARITQFVEQFDGESDAASDSEAAADSNVPHSNMAQSRASDSSASESSARESIEPNSDVVRIHVQALNNLGLLERDLGRYESAIRRYEKALEIARRHLGELDLDTAMVLNSIGMWCKFTGRFERGRAVYGEALEILRRVHGSDDEHPSIATLFHNLGGLEHAAGAFVAAEPFARKSVEIRRRAVGTAHADYAADVGALAAIVADLGRCDEAETLYREALAIFQRLHGDDHYEIAVLLHNLAAVEVTRNRFDAAWDLYHNAAAMKEKWLGADHPDLALTL
ncbi:MAG TPA: tetratricopeptide repeat protein, partial [Pirellulaceae bacterium]|nr:tetratricopeptide repeat protein [Pirellulaceae bacterium]